MRRGFGFLQIARNRLGLELSDVISAVTTVYYHTNALTQLLKEIES